MGKNEKLLSDKVLREYRDTEQHYAGNTGFFNRIIEKREDLKTAYEQYGLSVKTYKKTSAEFKKLFDDANHSMNHKCNKPSTFEPGPWRDFIILKKDKMAAIDATIPELEKQKNLLCANFDKAIEKSAKESETLVGCLDCLNTASGALAKAEKYVRSNMAILHDIDVARRKAQKEDPEYQRMYGILKADRELMLQSKKTYNELNEEVLKLEAQYTEQIYNYRTNNGITIIPL